MIHLRKHTYNGVEYESYEPDIHSFFEEVTYDNALVQKLEHIHSNIGELSARIDLQRELYPLAMIMRHVDEVSSAAIDGSTYSVIEYGTGILTKEKFALDIAHIVATYDTLFQDKAARSNPITPQYIEQLYNLFIPSDEGIQSMRTTQIWIGSNAIEDAAYIPPHPARVHEIMHQACSFLHQEHSLSPLLTMALFEATFFLTLPFASANAKMLRLIQPLLLESFFSIPAHILPLSTSIQRHLREYNLALQKIYQKGDIMEWIHIYTTILLESTAIALQEQHAMNEWFAYMESTLTQHSRSVKHIPSLLRAFATTPVVDSKRIARHTSLTKPNANALIATCEEYGILEEITKGKRNKKYIMPFINRYI